MVYSNSQTVISLGKGRGHFIQHTEVLSCKITLPKFGRFGSVILVGKDF